MSTCIFCRIISREIGSSRVLEEELVVAFLDISPINRGHTLVVPRRHVGGFTELTPDEVRDLGLAGQKMAKALKKAFPEYAGITFSLAEGEAAGQEVPHAHLHIIPRFAGDGFGWRRLGTSEDRTSLDAVALKIEAALQRTTD